jgi:hypothetical protein
LNKKFFQRDFDDRDDYDDNDDHDDNIKNE